MARDAARKGSASVNAWNDMHANYSRASIDYQEAASAASGSKQMKTLITVITATAVLAAGSLWAQETDPTRQIAEAWQAEQEMRAEHEERLNELMTVMAEEMEAIHEAGDRSERQQLLAQHRQHMHEAMELMRDLGGSHMREVTKQHLGPQSQMHHSPGMAGTMMQGRPRQHMSDSTRLDDLETRVDMMQIMLESMLTEDVGS